MDTQASCSAQPATTIYAVHSWSVLVKHALDLHRIVRDRQRQAQQDTRLLRVEIVGSDHAFRRAGCAVAETSRSLAIAGDDHDALRARLFERGHVVPRATVQNQSVRVRLEESGDRSWRSLLIAVDDIDLRQRVEPAD